MTLLQWREEFSIGIDEVDYEHRHLIDLINQAYARLGEGAAGGLDLVLGEIYAVVSSHFALEEKQMRARGYPAFAEHKEDHEALLDDLLEIMDRAERGRTTDEPSLEVRLSDWFGVHFRTHDARLHRFLEAPGGQPPR